MHGIKVLQWVTGLMDALGEAGGKTREGLRGTGAVNWGVFAGIGVRGHGVKEETKSSLPHMQTAHAYAHARREVPAVGDRAHGRT
jgi:hypothetical protein